LKSKILYIVIIVLFAVPAWAQQESCVNNIHLNKHILCVGETINAAPCDNNGNIIPNLAADYNYGESLTDTVTRAQNPQHVYNAPGIYKIRQAINLVQTSRIASVLPKASPLVQLSYCEGRTISLSIKDTSYTIFSLDSAQKETYAYDQYVINFGDGNTRTISGQSQTEVYTYTATGNSFNITVRGVFDAAACGGDTTLAVDFSNKQFIAPITSTLTVLDQSPEGRVELAYNGFNYLFYKLEQKTGTGAYQAIDTLNPQTQEATWQNNRALNTDLNIYCFRLTTINYCDESRNLPSDEICSTHLQARVDAAAGAINLEWPRYPISANGLTYQLFRNNVALSNPIAANGPASYTDSTVACGQTYSYRLEVVYEGQYGPLRSVSATQTVTAESTRPLAMAEGFYSTVENNQVVLRWNNPESILLKSFTISRNSSAIASIKDTVYIDSIANISASNCYTLSYEDSCGNKSAITPQSCPVRLTVQNSGRYINDLQWTPYIGWQNGVSHYIIEYLDHDNNIYNSIPLLTQTNYTDDKIDPEQQVLRYRIKAVPNDFTLPPSYSNIVEIKQRVRLIFPNAFNPNGHPENQFFKPKGRYITEYNLQIFNRWGELVYQTYDFSDLGWDGTFRGKPAPEDVYVYKVVARDETGERLELTGTVMLIRTH
jgi:gliding motility-associated-like protein